MDTVHEPDYLKCRKLDAFGQADTLIAKMADKNL
jgi:hypothetical protein